MTCQVLTPSVVIAVDCSWGSWSQNLVKKSSVSQSNCTEDMFVMSYMLPVKYWRHPSGGLYWELQEIWRTKMSQVWVSEEVQLNWSLLQESWAVDRWQEAVYQYLISSYVESNFVRKRAFLVRITDLQIEIALTFSENIQTMRSDDNPRPCYPS